MPKISKHFTRAEVACKCGCGFDSMDIETLKIADEARDFANEGITPSSACRCHKRVFTSFITASPQFMVANSLRDTMHAMAIGNLSYNGFKNFAEGAKD
jgi:hypothetical protein